MITKYPEDSFNEEAKLNYFHIHRDIKTNLYKYHKSEIEDIINRNFEIALEDAKEYLGITTDDFYLYANEWYKKEEYLFVNKNSVQDFYISWENDYAKYNICANVLNAFQDEVNFSTLYKYFYNNNEIKVITDYGCGTGSLSIAFCMSPSVQEKERIILLDVQNDVSNFVKYRIAKHNLSNKVVYKDVLTYVPEGKVDGLYCIDVLEHLENASEIFIDKISPMIKYNGLLYLKAPWRGQLTHIDEAPDNFYSQGGRDYLESNYQLIYRCLPIDIASVYKKIK